jgi:uncharacterized membrane protein
MSWWRVILPLSLVLNLFLVGVIGGHVMRTRLGTHPADAPPLIRVFTNATRHLSAEDAAKFNAVIAQNAPAYAESAKKLAQTREELQHQILAEPFDRAATLKAYAAWQANLNTFASSVGDSFIDALGTISPEGRQRMMSGRRILGNTEDTDESKSAPPPIKLGAF